MKTKGLKMLVWLLTALLLLAPGVARLAEPEDEYEYYLDDSANAIITKYNGVRSHVQIPTMLDNFLVVGIGPKAFSGNTVLTNLEIHNHVTEIELGAFQGCVNLGDVRFGAGLSSIGISAFENTALYRVQLPASLAYLYNRAFANCSYLRRVNLPRDLRPIGSEVFAGCPNLILEVYKGSPGHAYALENHIQHQVVPESISLPATASVIKGSQVQLQASAEPPEASQEVTWHSSNDNIATVDDKGLVTGVGLGTATITATAKLGSGVTGSCKITVTQPVTSITLSPASASLEVGKNLVLTPTVQPDAATNKKVTWRSSDKTIATVSDTGEVHGSGLGTADITALAQDGSGVKATCSVTVYPKPPAEFTYEHNLVGITITGYTGSAAEVTVPGEIEGKPVTRIGDNAFSEKTGITRVVLPGSIRSIEFKAFSGCSSLVSINLPEGLLTLVGRAFWGCGQLSGITLPQSLTSIDWGVFEHCSSLTNLKIPDGVTKIGPRAFYGCSSLSAVGLPPGLTEIEGGLFLDCTSLAGITIPDGVTSIGLSAFQECKSLNRITIRSHVTSFGEKAFGGSPVTIYGDVPSAAKDYADKNNIPFVDLAKGIPGDANNDLEVNTLDLISLMNYLVKDTPCPSMKNADANQDSKVDHQDAVAIINMIVGD